MVVSHGNAPWSSDYQSGALLLSYKTFDLRFANDDLRAGDTATWPGLFGQLVKCLPKLAEGVGNAPTPVMPVLFSRQVQPACICLPSKLALAEGFSPSSPMLEPSRSMN
jgi:hypothetical protein